MLPALEGVGFVELILIY